MTGCHARVEDPVQEALVTNFRGWLITPRRSTYFSQYRNNQREVENPDGALAERLLVDGGQQARVEMKQVQAAIDRLPEDQREILLMAGVAELPYKEASAILNRPVGAVKGRLNRARAKLAQLIDLRP